MSKEELIAALKGTEKYDREIALIDLYIFLLSEKEMLSDELTTQLFIELSSWRDWSLRDGVEAYYDQLSPEEFAEFGKLLEDCPHREISEKYLAGMKLYQQDGDFSELDDWIIENEWNINDFLVELASKSREKEVFR